MFRTLTLSTLLLMAVGLPTLRAESFTQDGAVAYALKNNPELAAARYSIGEARGRLLQSGRLANPELETDLKPNVRGREFSFGVGFVQRFPLTSRLRLEKAISQAEVTAAEAEVRAAEWRLAIAVRQTGIKLLSLQQRRALKERQITNSTELARSAAELAKKAEGSETDAAQYELEARQLSLDILQSDVEKASLTGELITLLGMSGKEEVEITGQLPEVALPKTAEPEVTGRADYQAAQARLDAARQSVDLAKAGKWEDAAVGLTAELERTEDAPEGLGNDGFIGIRFSLPLPWWNRNEGRIQEAQATVERTRLEAQAIAARTRAEAAASLREMKAAARILEQIKTTLLPGALALEERLQTFYSQGQPGARLADVLRAREKRLALEQAGLDALRSYHMARIRLAATAGR